MFCFSSRWFEFFSWLERTAKGYQMLDWCKSCWLSSLQCQDWSEQFTMLSLLVNAYSSYWKFFGQTIIFWMLLGAILPFLAYWLVVWEADTAGKLQLHIPESTPDVTSVHDYIQAVRSAILTVNTHTGGLITPFAVMYSHMFSHPSTETRKSHTYCQIPGYWASLGILLSDMWVAEHKANSAGVYNRQMLLVSTAVHRWL